MKNVKFFLFSCCILAAVFSCKDSENEPPANKTALEPGTYYEGQGQIVGAEYAACMCCGGYWLLTAESDSVLFWHLPANTDFEFQPGDQFPIPVEYEIFTDSSVCWQVKRHVELLSVKRL